jgi:acyl CoA:acetate/3-ketoacid CoA transferase alpha subunit
MALKKAKSANDAVALVRDGNVVALSGYAGNTGSSGCVLDKSRSLRPT